MAEVIQGSKSSLYIKEQIPGIEDSSDSFTHASVQNLWGGLGAIDTLNHGRTIHTLLPISIEAGSVKRLIKSTGHSASKGDVMRMDDGPSAGEEISIIKIVDADFFVISKEINAIIGDKFFILKPVTPTYAKDGSVITTSGPTKFIEDSIVINTEVDNVTPTDTKPFPIELFFRKSGVPTKASYDPLTPGLSNAIPVNIVTVNGTGVNSVVNLEGAQINVQLSHNNALAPDSVQIGDGTEVLLINTDGSINIKEVPKTLKYVQSITLDDITEQSFSPPLLAKGLKIIAGADNLVNLMVSFDGIPATSTYGQEIEPARSEDYTGVSTVSVICKSAATNHKVSLIWSV
jgi:hypothetical protein